MNLFDIIQLHLPQATATNYKLHLAVSNGREDPLDVFFAGNFEKWQSWQGQKNFERPYIVSLIKLPGSDRWLFARCYEQLGRSWVEEPAPHHSYKTREVQETTALAGRVVVQFHRSGRASYLNADRWAPDLEVSELLPERMSVGTFPGYNHVRINKATLDLVTGQEVASWRGALSNVLGIYLITDTKTGKLYVGSATGQDGIWARWCGYSATGHGGNKDLRAVLKEKGREYAQGWQWSILEIADTHATDEEILARESHWKEVLDSREHGYNAN